MVTQTAFCIALKDLISQEYHFTENDDDFPLLLASAAKRPG